jgi:urease alpha subunit
MRVTFGKVDRLPIRKDRQYYGVKDNFYTDMKGMVAKYKKGDAEFDLPQRLLDLYKKRFRSIQRQKRYMPVNFLSE